MAGGQDIAFTNVNGLADLKILNGDFVADNGLENAVLVSLFSDRYVPKEDLPDGIDDVAGWWGDALLPEEGDRIGSRIWILNRVGKLNLATRNLMKDYVEEALEWMITQGIAARIEVIPVLVSGERIDVPIRIFRQTGDVIPFQFLWDGQELKKG